MLSLRQYGREWYLDSFPRSHAHGTDEVTRQRFSTSAIDCDSGRDGLYWLDSHPTKHLGSGRPLTGSWSVIRPSFMRSLRSETF